VREFADPVSERYSERFRERAAARRIAGNQKSQVPASANAAARRATIRSLLALRGAAMQKLDRFAFRLTSKKTKRLTASTVSIRQALNC